MRRNRPTQALTFGGEEDNKGKSRFTCW